MNKTNYKIASVIILYNPTEQVVNNIVICSEQTDIVYVVDNSDVVNDNLIQKILGLKKIDYYCFNENRGVAFALNFAAELAIKNDFDFLLTMDQDSLLTPGMLKEMIDNCEDIENVGIISPLHRNKFRTQEFHSSRCEEVLSVKTSGNLLNLNIYQKAGPFNEDLFIDYIDIEYGMRLNLLGYKVVRVNMVLLEHREADLSEINIFGRRIYPWNHHPLRWYYKIRNLLYLEEKYKEYYPDFFNKEKAHYRRQLIKILLFEKNKIKKIKFGFKGYRAYKKKIKGIRIGA